MYEHIADHWLIDLETDECIKNVIFLNPKKIGAYLDYRVAYNGKLFFKRFFWIKILYVFFYTDWI
jgi:hypothetical protein